ncbi:Xaa-Pro aminopeptidase [Granulosicoccaceae sp. 1_MG-2023]|nr:Xaa-Pro aminopeptidase [Granulosicoccaceae sp. 1_MG-2023]
MLNATQLKEFARRRRSLMRTMGNGAIAIIPAARETLRNGDADYPYRQNSDFYYLSGFHEPEAVIVLIPGRKQAEFILFCRERDPLQETWHGRRLGVERAPEALGADDAFPISDIDDIMPGLIEGRERVYYTIGVDPTFDSRVLGWINRVRATVRSGSHVPAEFVALDYHLHEMRLFKSRSELATMRRAAKLTAQGQKRGMQACRPGMYEYELEAELVHEYRRNGAVHSFLPIVGGGENGCILHYTENQDALRDGDLVLIDTGAEVDCYAGDVTRTYPVNGKFSEAQREVYQIVLDAQLAAIDCVRPGNHWNMPHEAAVKVITQGLVKLGLLKGKVATLIKEEAYRKFYMHRTGHWLGLDVHDVGEYKVDGQWRQLEPGMVVTVEPGLYITSGKGIPAKYENIGIRIEDDVAVTKDGPEVLSKDAPKTIDEIEAVMAGG